MFTAKKSLLIASVIIIVGAAITGFYILRSETSLFGKKPAVTDQEELAQTRSVLERNVNFPMPNISDSKPVTINEVPKNLQFLASSDTSAQVFTQLYSDNTKGYRIALTLNSSLESNYHAMLNMVKTSGFTIAGASRATVAALIGAETPTTRIKIHLARTSDAVTAVQVQIQQLPQK